MTKTQYLDMKKAGYYSWELFYEYFIDYGGNGSFEDFRSVIGTIWSQLIGNLQMLMINIMTEYFDKKLAVVKLFDKSKNFIKEW